MKRQSETRDRVALAVVLWGVVLVTGPAVVAGPSTTQPPKVPADIRVSVAPEAVAAGESVEITLKVVPKNGIKINRYPKIKLEIPDVPGLVAGGKAAVGNDKAPSPEEVESGKNYFKSVEPVTLVLELDGDAAAGKHEITGKLKYFYCVASSGFCAPSRTEVTIPVSVR